MGGHNTETGSIQAKHGARRVDVVVLGGDGHGGVTHWEVCEMFRLTPPSGK